MVVVVDRIADRFVGFAVKVKALSRALLLVIVEKACRVDLEQHASLSDISNDKPWLEMQYS